MTRTPGEIEAVAKQIYDAVRAFTCATRIEAEMATNAIIGRLLNNGPDDGTCGRCGAAPRGENGLCATCRDEDAYKDAQMRGDD